jgi:GTP-binding protein
MQQVNEELRLFNPALAQKPQLVAVNKIDLPQVGEKLESIAEAFGAVGIRPLFISAASGKGLDELKAAALKLLEEATGREKAAEPPASKIFRPRPREAVISVSREGDVWVAAAPDLERLVTGSDTRDGEVRRQLQGQFNRLGLTVALKRAGVTVGGRVRLGKLEWKW